MTCKEVQSLIITYVNDKMDVAQLEPFLEHIEHCSDCKEELEVYYTLLTGMKQLDEERSLSSNLHLDFENKLRKSEERVKRSKLHYMRKRAIYIGFCIIFALITNWGIETINEEKESPQETVTESTFLFKYYYFRNRSTTLERVVVINYEDMMRYLIEHGMDNIADEDILDRHTEDRIVQPKHPNAVKGDTVESKEEKKESFSENR